MKVRSQLIDASKGFGILLVVFGHCLQSLVPDFDNNLVFRLVYSFHMPLFMFLSGCVAKYSDVRSITKNVTRLVLPFLTWYLIGYAVLYFRGEDLQNFPDYFMKLVKSPDYGLWFLWVLFLSHICFYVMSQMQKVGGILAAVLGFFLVQYIPLNILGIGLLKWHFVFFVAGYLAIRYQDIIVKYRYAAMLGITCLFIVLFPFWQRIDNTMITPVLDHLPKLYKYQNALLIKYYRYLTAFAGIGTVISLVYFMIKLEAIKMALAKLGQYTMEIYVSHQLLFGYGFGKSIVLKIATTFTEALFVSLGLGLVLKRIPYVSLALYGVQAEKRKP
jgi:fucose 4-O-acetylase-like acetyltransferase